MINKLAFDFAACVRASEQVAWRLEEVLPSDAKFDFAQPFLPDVLAGNAKSLTCLSPSEQLKLNHIRGNSYLHLFAFVEEYIIATALQHAEAETFGDRDGLRAMLRFADEEVKHQTMFKRACELFERSFPTPCGLIPDAEAVAGVILSKSPMAVLLMTLHLELMTQCHYVDAVHDNAREPIDPLFRSMLKHHWVEEAQHAKIDVLELKNLSEHASAEMIDQAVEDYIGLLHALRGLLDQQAALDVSSLEHAAGRTLDEETRAQVLEVQARAYRHLFIGSGVKFPQFQKWCGEFSEAGLRRVNEDLANLL